MFWRALNQSKELNTYCIDSALRPDIFTQTEAPAKSGFDQVHVASTGQRAELGENPVSGNDH
jgi:hypothetical protein